MNTNIISVHDYKKYSKKEKQIVKRKLANFYNNNFLLSKWSLEYFYGFLTDENEREMECFVAEKSKKLVGFILGRMVGNISNRYNLTTLLVDKNDRGKGYSTLLLDAFLKRIRKNKKVEKVYLHFRDSNNFENFYTHYGFSGHRVTGTYSNEERKHYMEMKF
jgi:ribosomal protein S18 acetylase RimI-like enzyme